MDASRRWAQLERRWLARPGIGSKKMLRSTGLAGHGGQLGVARHLRDRSGDLRWIYPWDGLTPLDAATRSQAGDGADWLRELGAQ